MARMIWTAVSLLLAAAAPAAVDPHRVDDPLRCVSCHTPEIHSAPAASGGYHLLLPTIDGICLVCHRKEECCRVGQEHQDRRLPTDIGVTHPSDLAVDDVPSRQRPRTLPVFDGRITCNTCHFHDRQVPLDYKMVRKVVISDRGVDWTPLCADCHAEY